MPVEDSEQDILVIAGLMKKHGWLRIERHCGWVTAFPPYFLRTKKEPFESHSCHTQEDSKRTLEPT